MCSAADRDLSADKRAPSGERPRRVVLQSVFIVCRPVPLRLRALPCDETHARVGRRTATLKIGKNLVVSTREDFEDDINTVSEIIMHGNYLVCIN